MTTDHISPAGSIKPSSPAGRWLVANGVVPTEFNSYGTRRGNHEVMIRGTFANTRIRNVLAGGVEGGVTVHLPDATPGSIYDVAAAYRAEGVPLIVLAGKEYGSGRRGTGPRRESPSSVCAPSSSRASSGSTART